MEIIAISKEAFASGANAFLDMPVRKVAFGDISLKTYIYDPISLAINSPETL